MPRQRRDRLFRTVHPKDRGPYTPAEAAEAINKAAGERVVSGTYLWLLRTALAVPGGGVADMGERPRPRR